MAAGEGGFSTQLNGFNKNEVTEYIGKISKEKLTLQNDLKEAENKMNAAEKRAEEAEKKAETVKTEADKQVADATAMAKEARKKAEEYINEIDELKRKLRNGGGSTIKESDEIINEAKRKAQQIIDDAKRTAAGMSAGGAGAPAIDTAAFMAAFKGFQNTVNAEMQKFSAKASQILNTPAVTGDATPVSDGFFAGMDDSTDDAMDDNLTDMAAGFGIAEDAVTEVQPLADPELPKNEIVESFDSELLAQTTPDASVNMEDMFKAAAEDEPEIRNDEPVGFDMGNDSAQSDLDAMNALLGQMSASLSGMGGGSSEMEMGAEPESKPEPASAAEDNNPWADLQAQLNAMEMSGDFGGDDSTNDAQPDITSDAQSAPSADDADIWNFGMDMDMGSSGSSDDDSMSGDMGDDMSADLFAGFN